MNQIVAKIKSRKFLYLALILVLIAGLVGFFLYKKNTNYDLVKPRVGSVVEAVYGLGTVIGPQTYQVKTGVNQKIVSLYVREGDVVKIGDPLIQLDESGINRSPIAGTVTAVPFRKGELLFPGVAAITLVNLQDLYLEVSLEQQTILRVTKGQKAIISFESLRGEKMEGLVQSIFPKDNQFVVHISLEKFPTGVLPGMTADVAIQIGKKENVLTIPVSAISSGVVNIRRNGKTIKQKVQLGITDGEWAEIISDGISPDDEIIVRTK